MKRKSHITHPKRAKRKKVGRKKTSSVEGQERAARAIGVSVETIELARKLNAPGCNLGGRYNLEELAPWIGANAELLKQEGGKNSRGQEKADVELEILKLKFNDAAGLVVEKKWVAGKMRELGQRVTALLYAKLVNEFPTMMTLDVTSNRVSGQNLANSIIAEINSMAGIFEGK